LADSSAQTDLEKALASGRRPAIFMFQPNKFEAVPPDRLAEWEYQVEHYVGLPAAQFDREKLLASATWSDCGEGRICPDDSDYHDVEHYGGRLDPSDASAALAGALAAGRKPTVFMWQPSRFELVEADRLAEWERNIREHVGLPVSAIRRDQGGSETGSATLPKDCIDDSDYQSE
jgi:hypothetical protein